MRRPWTKRQREPAQDRPLKPPPEPPSGEWIASEARERVLRIEELEERITVGILSAPP